MKEIISEAKFDGVVKKLVKDIIFVYKDNKEGNFRLPEDINNEEMVYVFDSLESPLSLDVNLFIDPRVDNVEVDADYYRDEETIEVTIVSNPNINKNILQKLIGKLNETIRHELEHYSQFQKGFIFPDDPLTPLEYFLQTHEIEAQLAGFKRRAKKEKRPLEDVIDEWFKENKRLHRLRNREVEKVKKILMNYE